jgi:hypothetical protein
MHRILVILKKDIRQLRWEIAAMLALSAAVGWLDGRRLAAQPAVLEGLLNIVLTVVWGCLIGQSVQAEALVGDREFWMTRPYRWPHLLAAKALFVALFIHVPSFLTDAAILAVHGFNPFAALPQLLGKQLLLAGGLTLPAMALAAVVNNLMQFVVGVPVLFATTAVSVAFRQSYPFGLMVHYSHYSTVSRLAMAFLALAAAAVVVLQYWRRQTGLARILAVTAMLAVGLLIAVFSQPQTFSVTMDEFPAANMHLAMTLAPPDPRIVHWSNGRRVFTELPYNVSGLAPSNRAWMMTLSMEIAGDNGVRYQYQPPRADFDVGMPEVANGPGRISLSMSRAAYERIGDSKVTISGTVGFEVIELGQPVRLPVGATGEAIGRMRCSTTYDEGRYDYGWLAVFCESPYRDGLAADIRTSRSSGNGMGQYVQRIGTNGSPSPLIAWLSPLQRRQQSFQVVLPDGQTLDQALGDRPIVIVPQRVAGYAIASFRAVQVDLREYSK